MKEYAFSTVLSGRLESPLWGLKSPNFNENGICAEYEDILD